MHETELKKIKDKWVHDPVFLVLDIERLVNEVERLRTGVEDCAKQADEQLATKLRSLLQ